MDQYLNVKYADDYLDLVAVGNCGDMMDYTEPETHYYINEGFKNINNIFLREFITTQEFSMKGKVSPFTVSWYVVPYINAMARTGTIEEKEMLFQSLLDFKAETLVSSNKRGEKGEQVPLVKEAVRICGLVKARQEKLKKEILDKIDNSSYVDNSCGIIIICMPHDKIESSENLNGLIAN
uniref:Single-stranded-DNA-specific exonuclease RecJ n=1 Tax=Siphoviridae sp. ctxMM9 TaxID=2827973 RepID=A0A8S5T6F7_9CAUD|nr:MAG TPA: single-stranded-DNA-specific exonuclease RecJ [Siphoviridae sp. ctxMM9]